MTSAFAIYKAGAFFMAVWFFVSALVADREVATAANPLWTVVAIILWPLTLAAVIATTRWGKE